MKLQFSHIAEIVEGELIERQSCSIRQIITDSRLPFADHALFVALEGKHFDGHQFIPDLLDKGVTNFIVSQPITQFHEGNFIIVEDTLRALQQLAAYIRKQFQIPVLGITGSNAKTIMKEWIFQLLSEDFSIVKSPKSFNSQVGVPLSVFQMKEYHNLAIFEAGISTKNEMHHLGHILKPTIGIFTNIGSAHSEGFESIQEKIQEKIKLFVHAETIIFCEQHQEIKKALQRAYPQKQLLSWSIKRDVFSLGRFQIDLSTFPSGYFRENLGHCIAFLYYMGIVKQEIEKKIQRIQPIAHRLQLLEGKQQSYLINDSYNNDFAGLEVALQFAKQQANTKPLTLILSNFEESNLSEQEQANRVIEILNQYDVEELVGIGSLFHRKEFLSISQKFFPYFTTQDFLNSNFPIANKAILVKGARTYQLERIIGQFQKKNHDTVWEISLSALVNNLNVYKSLIQQEVKLLVMVKALAYGTSADQVAQLLQYLKVDYLGVAYPEEGRQLREAGIQLPILVLNASEYSFATAVEANLDISIYSIQQFQQFLNFCQQNQIKKYPIQVKLDTGMHRLGFTQEEVGDLISLLKSDEVKVTGIFSHLSVADKLEFSEFTRKQQKVFDAMLEQLLPHCEENTVTHLLNSSGIVNPDLKQYDMVRLGIGLYGISSNQEIQEKLMQVGVLKATISQIKNIKPGDHVGYGAAFIADKEMRIGTISIGYADGYDRRFGNGMGEVIVQGKRAKTIGNICMDMTMIDLSQIDAKAGDEVIITSEHLPITSLAQRINTIPYELLTDVSPRIPRRFVFD